MSYAQKPGQKLIRVDAIKIYQGEIDYINKLEIDYLFKKVLFTFLVQMKLNKYVYEFKNEKEYNTIYFKGGTRKYKSIQEMANIPQGVNINSDVIYFLSQMGLITILHNGLISLDFMNQCEQNGKVVLKITNYENIGYYLDWYNQDKRIKICSRCGTPFKPTGNYHITCKECRGYVPVSTKQIICIDCGFSFEVDSKNTKTVRCRTCTKEHRKEYKTNDQKRRRSILKSLV